MQHSSNLRKLLSRPDESLTQSELQLVIYSRLHKAYPKTATYEIKVKQLIREYLPIISTMNPTTMIPVIKGLRTLIRRDEWINVANMFKGIFVFLAKSQIPQLLYKHIDPFLRAYPEFKDLPEDEKKALLEYRNTTVAAMRLFDPRDKKSDFFGLVGRTFGPSQTMYFESSLFTTRRTLIFERETGVLSAQELVHRPDRKRARVSPQPPELVPESQPLASPPSQTAQVIQPVQPFFPVLSPEEEATEGTRLLHEAMMQIAYGHIPLTVAHAPLYTSNGACEGHSPLLSALHHLTRAYLEQRLSQSFSGESFSDKPMSSELMYQDPHTYQHDAHYQTDQYRHAHQQDWSSSSGVSVGAARSRLQMHAHYVQELVHGAIPRLLEPPSPHDDAATAAASHPSLATPSPSVQEELIADPARVLHTCLSSFAALGAAGRPKHARVGVGEVTWRSARDHHVSLAYNPHTAQMSHGQNQQMYQAYLQYVEESHFSSYPDPIWNSDATSHCSLTSDKGADIQGKEVERTIQSMSGVSNQLYRRAMAGLELHHKQNHSHGTSSVNYDTANNLA